MKNYITRIIFATWVVAFLSSCEKVIDVKVTNAAKKFVIEGVITDQQGGCAVLISQTHGLNEEISFSGVSGAKVTITDETGAVTRLVEDSLGIYKSNIIGLPGKKYTLEVNINGEVITANSRMPLPVSIDSIYISELSLLNENSKWVNVQYKDPPGMGNNHRFVQFINRKKDKGVYVINDDLTEGRNVTTTLFTRENSVLKMGDTVAVEMHCIDPAMYKYWFSLSQSATGETETASPANPVTNLSGGTLGYFSAHTVRSKSIIVK